jgi:hypothetical protein
VASLCAGCREARLDAAERVEGWMTQRECFVARSPAGDWSPLEDGAREHWLAHELRVRALPSVPSCMLGHPIRLEDVLRHRRELARGVPLSPGDVWVDLDGSDCGLVAGVLRDPERGLQITVRHLSPERAVVASDDFYRHLCGRGSFYR